jgi:minor extracellular serine protease Vpr
MRLLLLLFTFITINAFSQTQMPASTIGVIQTLSKELKKNNGKLSSATLKMYPLETHAGEYFIHVLAKTNSSFSLGEVQNEGWKTGMFFGQILSARIPLNIFLNHFSNSAIDYIEVAERLDAFLDLAVADTRADSVHLGINLPQSYTGKDVIIGVVDWGFDYSHPTFYDTAMQRYRVVAAWDQVKTGTPPNGFSHGAFYGDSISLLTAQADTFSYVSDYHGTHCAGIAGGAGAGTNFRGIGFDADLLFSQMGGHATYSLDAFQWMFNMSQSLGKRLVINNSYGSYRNNPLDGTSLTSQVIDAFSDSGVVFIFSAGNNGASGFHIKKQFNNDSIRSLISGFNYAGDPDLWGQTITMWGEVGKNFSAKIRVYGSSGYLGETDFYNNSTALPFTDTFLVFGMDTIYYTVTADLAHPLNGRAQMSFDVKKTNSSHSVILISEANNGTVHFYNTRKTIFGGGNTGNGFTTFGAGYNSGDNFYGLGHPGVTNSAITIAAHTTNSGMSSFSSFGPRIDENPKPDVSAPGVNIASAFSSFSFENVTSVGTVNFNSKDFDFVRLSGTSMSGPMVTGIVSLILEANPTITSQEIKDLLRVTAREDNFTGVLAGNWHNRWGWGKVNAYAAITNLNTVNISETAIENVGVYPNPTNGMIYFEGDLTGSETILVYSLDGKLMLNKKITENYLDLSAFEKGMYLLKITNEKASRAFKLILEK